MISPEGSTTSKLRTFSLMVPYLTALVPDALVAAIPHRDASAPGSRNEDLVENGSENCIPTTHTWLQLNVVSTRAGQYCIRIVILIIYITILLYMFYSLASFEISDEILKDVFIK